MSRTLTEPFIATSLCFVRYQLLIPSQEFIICFLNHLNNLVCFRYPFQIFKKHHKWVSNTRALLKTTVRLPYQAFNGIYYVRLSLHKYLGTYFDFRCGNLELPCTHLFIGIKPATYRIPLCNPNSFDLH